MTKSEAQSGSLRQRATSGGRWTTFSAVISVSIQLAQLSALGRLLEPSDFGLMAMMMVVIGLATSVADFGVGNFLVQANTISRRLLLQLFSLGVLLSVFLANAIAMSANLVASYYQSVALANLIPWLALVVITTTISQLMFAILQRAFKFKAIALAEITSVVIGLLVTVSLAFFGYGVWSLIVGQIAVGASKSFFYYPAAKLVFLGFPKQSEDTLMAALRFGSYQIGDRLLNFAGWNLDKVIIGRLLGDAALGIYSVAYQLMLRPFSVLNPIFTRVSLPIFSSIKHDDARLSRGYLQVLRTIALVSFPLYLGVAITSSVVITILVGSKWLQAAPVLSILCVLGMLFSLSNPIGTLVLAKGKPHWAFYFNLLSIFVYGLAFWIGSSFGITGVATAFLISSFAVIYPMEFYLRWKLVGMSVGEYFGALKHLFFAVFIPFALYGFLQISGLMVQGMVLQILLGISGVSFFFAYLWFCERSLINSTYSLLFQGK